MKKTGILTLLVITLFVFGGVTANAQKGMMGHGSPGGGKFHKGFSQGKSMIEMLELTTDQIKQVRAMRLETQKKLIPIKSDLKLARLELHEMIRNGALEAEIDRKIDQMSAIRTNIQKINVHQRLALRNMLTDEQKAKLETMPFGGRGQGGRHPRGHGPGMGMMNDDCMMFGEAPRGFRFGDSPWDNDGN